MIDRETLNARQMRRTAPKRLRLRHLPARANPRFGPFGLAWRAATEQNRLRKPASGESRCHVGHDTDIASTGGKNLAATTTPPISRGSRSTAASLIDVGKIVHAGSPQWLTIERLF
jgi:hypothetical protein